MKIQKSKTSKKLRIVANSGSDKIIHIRGNFDPIKHPRNPKNGKFVERPYSVPDNISNKATGELLGDIWAADPNFAENLDEIAIDAGIENRTQTVDNIVEVAKQGGLMGSQQAVMRDVYELDPPDGMSFSEFRERVQEVRESRAFGGDIEGAALAVVNQDG